MVKKFVLQWHLSERCNLRCRHCYQENHKPVELSLSELLKIYKQFKKLLKKLDMKGHINITGGEPLCHPHLYKILDEIKKDKGLISFSILTNGTLITKDIAHKLKSYNPEYVQVSLEGNKKMNDYIRGKGTYDQIAKALKYLHDESIFTSLSFTASKTNYKKFPAVIKYAVKNHVNNVWSDRYIPLGDNKNEMSALNLKETREYLQIMDKERRKLLKKHIYSPTISMYRALQFQMTNDFAYRCTAGDTLLTVMENGDLVPCRRMPIVVGNLLKDDMLKLYENSPVLKELRDNKVPSDCEGCENEHTCAGGLKCLTYALFKDLNHKDVGCNL